jgi:AraC-like DNA-binding protein/ligand-binding sensor protein
MIMEITETMARKAAPSKSGRIANAPAREFSMRVETQKRNPNPQPDPTDRADTRGDKELIRKLAACSLFQDYQQAFGEATGLPLTLRSAEDWQLAHASDRHQNAFCALVARNNRSCAGCLQMQQQVCNKANGVPATLRCSFGLNETAVTVKLGERTIGHLQTGQVFFHKPSSAQATSVVNRLQKLGSEIDAGEAKEAYQATRVVRRQTYDSVIRLLEFFAQQLSLLANQVLLQERVAELPQVARARQYIHDHCEEDLSLSEVARHAAISPFYLCKKFKEVTGLYFTDYVSRVRVEKAKQLLLNPNHRISEVAYQTGFQSLSHFNRCFKRITGESPTACRQQPQSI